MGEPGADLGLLGLGSVGDITFLDFTQLCPFIPHRLLINGTLCLRTICPYCLLSFEGKRPSRTIV